jgi:plasmid maintenance system killer protein
MERFGSEEARLIWEGRPNKAARRTVPSKLHTKTAALIDKVLNTATLRDCFSYPPGWRFKELHGKLRGTYQVRIDGQYRLRFQWDQTHGAVGIIVGEFHGDDD